MKQSQPTRINSQTHYHPGSQPPPVPSHSMLTHNYFSRFKLRPTSSPPLGRGRAHMATRGFDVWHPPPWRPTPLREQNTSWPCLETRNQWWLSPVPSTSTMSMSPTLRIMLISHKGPRVQQTDLQITSGIAGVIETHHRKPCSQKNAYIRYFGKAGYSP